MTRVAEVGDADGVASLEDLVGASATLSRNPRQLNATRIRETLRSDLQD